jgi:hypothetical protein
MPAAPSREPELDVDVHLVLDDFGPAGRAYREVDFPPVFEDVLNKTLRARDQLSTATAVSFDRVCDDLLAGQYNSPVRVIAFNAAEGWARDVSEDIAREVAKRAAEEGRSLDRGTRRFLARHVEERALPAEIDA